MRRAGDKRPRLSARASSATPSVPTLTVVGFDDPPTNVSVTPLCPSVSIDPDARHRALEIVIQQRIESRLSGRVRNLRVRALDQIVILEGECATYYSKQLAQHAAMAILEDEHLEN